MMVPVTDFIYPPTFDSFYVEAAVPENVSTGSLVTKVTAKDFDKEGSDNSSISYSIRASI